MNTWKSLKSEWSNNPFRSLIGFLQTIGILIVVSQSIWTFWNPPPTFLNIPTLLLELDTEGNFKGDITLIADNGPSIKRLSGRVYVNPDSQIELVRDIREFSLASNSGARIASVKVEKLPSSILFCFNGINAQGALLKQEILFGRKTSASSEVLKDKMGIYEPVPKADLPQQSFCLFK